MLEVRLKANSIHVFFGSMGVGNILELLFLSVQYTIDNSIVHLHYVW